MKLFIIKIVFLLSFVISFSNSYSQIVLFGEQRRGNNSNATLICEPVILTKTATIVAAEGDNDGFWIAGEQGIIQSFFPKKDSVGFNPNVSSFILKPGKYWVYPNLKINQEAATIKLLLDLK